MRLKRSTVSVSDVLKTSTSEDISGNSDDEFWEKDSSPGQHHLYSTIDHTGDTCEDDVFDDVESKHNKLQTHIYEQCDFAITQNHNPKSSSIHTTADDESSPSYAVVNKRQPSTPVSNQNTLDAGVHRESGYETTEPGDASDNIDNYNEIGGIEFGGECEETDGKLDDEVSDDGETRAVDLLKDLLRKTIVSGDLEDTDKDEIETNKEEEEISAMDKLRALLGNE
ncbi:uncharacterized protein LOC117116481 [Anneissia japonica]|uniref:uncharacterized protein LOC117116481 n=1 Tax=Anneissia japonica TaxID=1529436 RepID=UPI0014255E0C|nr:uncharacterized protein LOC117116481 [Anneissia japonica]